MKLLQAAEDFAGYLFPRKKSLDCDDIMLYGSIVHGSKTPRDLDLLIVHHNSAFEVVQEQFLKKPFPDDTSAFDYVRKTLFAHNYPSVDGFLEIPSCRQALSEGKFHTWYLHTRFFQNSAFREQMIALCPDPNFYKNVFSTGLLWNEKTSHFDTPAREKYGV